MIWTCVNLSVRVRVQAVAYLALQGFVFNQIYSFRCSSRSVGWSPLTCVDRSSVPGGGLVDEAAAAGPEHAPGQREE